MIVDVIAAALVIVGALLAALGGIGLVRFPDVFTRMHAATKSATVGAIAITAAAAAEAGAVSGILVLLLVIALLFLSSPLGMSLLARAAYHDPETPRSPNTRVLSAATPAAPPQGMRRSTGVSPLLAVWLLLVWVVVFGSLRPNVLVGGAVVAALLAVALRRIAPRWPHAFLHPIAAIRFVAHFTAQLLAATWDVTRRLVRRPSELQPAIVEIPLLVRTRNQVTLLMNAISFTPGTVALEVRNDRLFVHVLSTTDSHVVIAEANEMQRRIMEAFHGPS
jgi:multicomponent Na+:H+ antiporter subunit G